MECVQVTFASDRGEHLVKHHWDDLHKMEETGCCLQLPNGNLLNSVMQDIGLVVIDTHSCTLEQLIEWYWMKGTIQNVAHTHRNSHFFPYTIVDYQGV